MTNNKLKINLHWNDEYNMVYRTPYHKKFEEFNVFLCLWTYIDI